MGNKTKKNMEKKNTHTHTVGTVPKYDRKMVEPQIKLIPLTCIRCFFRTSTQVRAEAEVRSTKAFT